MMLKRILQKMNQSSYNYLPIKIVEGILGIFMLRIYTNLFLPSTYGDYNIFNPILLILYSFTIGWLSHASVRYVNHYLDKEEDKKEFFSTILLTGAAILATVSLGAFIGQVIFPGLLGDRGILFGLVLIFGFVGYSVNQVMVLLLLYMDKRNVSNALLVFSPALKILLTLLFVHQLGQNVVAIFLSHLIVDLAFGFIAIHTIGILPYVRRKHYSSKKMKGFLAYGYPLMGLSLVMSFLNVSDRFIIKAYYDSEQVGIYTANYSIASAIFAVLMVGLARSMYPKLLKAYVTKDVVSAEKHLALGIRNYFLISLPAATGLLLLSEPIAKLMIDEKYHSGNLVIGIVAFGYLFLGLTEYVNKGWELTGKTLNILKQCAFATILNIIANLLLVPRYGSIVSAYTTLFAFMVYFVISYLRRAKAISLKIHLLPIFRIIFSNLLMILAVVALKTFLGSSIPAMLAITPVAVIVYFLSLFLLKELDIQSIRSVKKGV